MYVDVVLWLVALAAMGAIALPITAVLFAPIRGRGAGFAVSIALGTLAVVTLWVGHLWYGPLIGWVAVGVLAACSGIAVARGVAVPWRRYGETLIVFALAFGLAVGLRSLSPGVEIWAKGFLNFGLTQSLVRADTLPPADMWFAGEPVRYYYGGHLIGATLALGLGTPATSIPNLAVPAFYATLVTGAYDLGGSLGWRRGAPRRLAGSFTAVLIALGGSLYEPLRLVLGMIPPGTANAAWTQLGLSAHALTGPFSAFAATHYAPFPTDVPIYSVLIGSLHAHVVSQPFTLLAVALAFTIYRTPAEARPRRWVRLLVLAVAVGVVAFVNLWSLPTAAGVGALAVALANDHPGTLIPEARRTWRRHSWPRGVGELGRYLGGGLVFLGLVILGLLTVSPFISGAGATRPIGVLPSRSTTGYYVVQFGWVLAAFTLFLGARLWGALTTWRGLVTTLTIGLAIIVTGIYMQFPGLAFVGPVLLLGWWLRRRGFGNPIPASPASATAGSALNRPERRTDGGRPDRVATVGYETVLLVAGAGLALAMELIYVQDGAAAGRYNTAFKVHSQVWLLWMIAAGAMLATIIADGLASVLDALRLPRTRRHIRFRRLRAASTLATAQSILAIGLVLIAVTFGVFCVVDGLTEPGIRDAGPSLDATAFVGADHPSYAEPRSYLASRVGQPHILEAAPTETAMFGFRANPLSSLTGLPTVAGWTHAADYHGEAAYNQRVADVRTIYESPGTQRRALLEEYGVEYVVVGPYERVRYDIAPFESAAGYDPVVTGEVTVYAVRNDH